MTKISRLRPATGSDAEPCIPSQRLASPRRALGFLKDEGGSVAVMVALSMLSMLGIMGFAIDVGQLRLAKQHLQMTADAAALAGALELGQCSQANCPVLQAAAQAALTENQLPGSTLLSNCATGNTTHLNITVNNGPCAVSGNPHNNNTSYVEVVIFQPQPTYFAGVLGIHSVPITVRAEAALGATQNCIYALGKTGYDVFLNGAGTVTISNCGILDNSSSASALLVNGSFNLTAKSIGVVGGVTVNGSSSVSPAPTTGVPQVTDPLASLQPPSFSAGSCVNYPAISSSTTLGPGCYNGLTINGGTVTLNPGVYIVNGALSINGAPTISGTGVTFYFPPGASAQINGGGTINLVAPTSGTYDGILFYQNPSNSAQMLINGAGTINMKGIMYLPDANLTFNGSFNTELYANLVVSSVLFNGSVTIGDYASVNSSSPLGSGAVLAQ